MPDVEASGGLLSLKALRAIEPKSSCNGKIINHLRLRMISVKLVDILCLIFAFILIVLVNINPLPENLEYIPGAVQGLTTLIGILIGFSGFCMTYLYSSFQNVEIRKRLRSRLRYVVLVITFALLTVGVAYGDLVYGRLFSSYKTILVGSMPVDILFLNTLFVLFSLVEEKQ